ncbi:MAG TPA: hypothetical protein VFZ48_03245 [Candidatus Saccharimonadales bacterium]
MSQHDVTPDVQDYAEDVFYSTADIVIQCLSVLLRTHFKTGNRTSLQDESKTARNKNAS